MWTSNNSFCDSVAYCADTDPDPISETTPGFLSVPDTALDTDSASAHKVANDSLQVLLQHGTRQSAETDATGSAMACAEAGAPMLSLTNILGGGMQVEDDLGDLDDTQVSERCSKRWKEDNVAKEMLTRCAEDAAGRATAELKYVTSRLLQDATDRDRRFAERERDQLMMEKLTGLVKGVSDTVDRRVIVLEQRVQNQWVVFEKWTENCTT